MQPWGALSDQRVSMCRQLENRVAIRDRCFRRRAEQCLRWRKATKVRRETLRKQVERQSCTGPVIISTPCFRVRSYKDRVVSVGLAQPWTGQRRRRHKGSNLCWIPGSVICSKMMTKTQRTSFKFNTKVPFCKIEIPRMRLGAIWTK